MYLTSLNGKSPVYSICNQVPENSFAHSVWQSPSTNCLVMMLHKYDLPGYFETSCQ